MLVPIRRGTNMASHTKLCNFPWYIFSNNSIRRYRTALWLSHVVYVSLFYNISISWLYLLNGWGFYFFTCVTMCEVKTTYLFIIYLFIAHVSSLCVVEASKLVISESCFEPRYASEASGSSFEILFSTYWGKESAFWVVRRHSCHYGCLFSTLKPHNEGINACRHFLHTHFYH